MRWYLQGIPPRRCLVPGAILLIVPAIICCVLQVCWLHLLEPELAGRVMNPILSAGLILSSAGAIVLAAYRVSRVPFSGGDYQEWLGQTPWTHQRRPPFGPWRPVAMDAIPLSILGVASAVYFAWMLRSNPIISMGYLSSDLASITGVFSIPTLIFFLVWSLIVYLQNCRDWNWSVFIPLLAIGLLIHLVIHRPDLAIIMAAGMSGVGAVAVLRRQVRMLKELPTDCLSRSERQPAQRELEPTARNLAPQPPNVWYVQARDRFRSRFLAVGGLVFVWLSLVPAPAVSDRDAEIFFAVLQLSGILLTGLFAAGASAGNLASHLNLSARWATGQWRVPKHDRIWRPLLLNLFLWAVVMVVQHLYAVSSAVTFPFTISAACMIAMATSADPILVGLTAPGTYRLIRRNQPRRSRDRNSSRK